jgi:hypothetical protein
MTTAMPKRTPDRPPFMCACCGAECPGLPVRIESLDQVNTEGPYCALCQSLILAARHARLEHKGLDEVNFRLEKLWYL